jgi:O-antigen biosynthesis protein
MVEGSPDPSLPRCSVVIATRARPEALAVCLGALRKQSLAPLEILVVESGGGTDAVEMLARAHGAGYLVESAPGASRARNRGLRASAGEVVAFTDDDAIPDPGWLRSIAAEFRDPAVGGVAGRVVSVDGSDGEAEAIARLIGLSMTGGDRRRRIDRSTSGWFEIANFGGVGIGPNMAFRRGALMDVGGFDERLGPGTPLRGGEEPYAFFALLKAGFAVAYTPDATVAHPQELPSLHEMRGRLRDAYSAATGHVTFLLLNERGYRLAALRYLLEGALGKRRTWRDEPPSAMPPLPTPAGRLAAYLDGFVRGVRASRIAR